MNVKWTLAFVMMCVAFVASTMVLFFANLQIAQLKAENENLKSSQFSFIIRCVPSGSKEKKWKN